ncbi:MAG: outer membrane beta-barrel protein [Pseudomonadota bacterium]
MNTRFLHVTLSVWFAVSGAAVLADSESGFYATATVGLGFLGEQRLDYRDAMTTSSADADFGASFTGGVAFGFRLNPRWRLESDVLYRRNDLDDVTLQGVGASTGGDFASFSIGFNVLRDFGVASSDRLRWYAGVGLVFVQEVDIDFEVGGAETSFETDEVGFQLQVGGRYSLSDQLYLDAGARYLSVSGAELEFPANTSRVVTSDYTPLTITVGVGWQF